MTTFRKELERYFNRNKKRIKEVMRAFNETLRGRKQPVNLASIEKYSDFLTVPPLNHVGEDLVVFSEDLQVFKTAGTTGKPKKIYREIGRIAPYPKEMDKELRGSKTIFIHSKRRSVESYYEIHDVSHREMYPEGIFLEFANGDSLMRAVSQGEILFFIEYPLMMEWVCYQLETLLKKGKIDQSKLRKQKIYLELSGELITERRLNRIKKRLAEIFQTKVEASVTYGLNEMGLVGTYLPEKHGGEIIYEVSPKVFVELVEGEIILTPFNTKGTILLRYKSGDRGSLFFKDGIPYIKIFGRKPELGYVSVAGSQFSLPSLYSYFRKALSGLPIGIECRKREDHRTGQIILNFILHIPKRYALGDKNKIHSLLMDEVVAQAELFRETDVGIVNINTEIRYTPMKKSWRLR